MMKVSACIFLCLLGAAWSQYPKPCTPPSQFRSRLSQYDHGHDVIRRYNMTYDEINKRKYIVEEERNFMPGRQFYTFIVLTQQNLLYTINHQTHTCTKTPNPTWRSIAIAPNSTFEDSLSFGGPGEVVYATQWSDRVPLRQRETLLVEFTVTRCYPLRAVLISRDDITSTISEFYYDYQAGIPDPSVFTPPAECNTATWAPPPKHFMGF